MRPSFCGSFQKQEKEGGAEWVDPTMRKSTDLPPVLRHIFSLIYKYIYIYIYVYTYIHIFMYIYIYLYIHVSIYAYIYMGLRVWVKTSRQSLGLLERLALFEVRRLPYGVGV